MNWSVFRKPVVESTFVEGRKMRYSLTMNYEAEHDKTGVIASM